MAINRRDFLKLSSRAGMATATLPLWSSEFAEKAFGQLANSPYKAIVVLTLGGGNDGNNLIVPISPNMYRQYAALRTGVALSQSSLIPLSGTDNSGFGPVGLHPAMINVAKRFNQRQALVVANVGPMVRSLTKAQLLDEASLQPEALFSHPAGQAQWLSSTTTAFPDTGWGGRIADLYVSRSGNLPPVLTASGSSIFTVGRTVQGIVVQAQGRGSVAIPTELQVAIRNIAEDDTKSPNLIVSQVARLRRASMDRQAILLQAAQYGTPLKAKFSPSALGASLQMIAKIINGRSTIGASRQLFYCLQGGYDNHQQLVSNQLSNLTDLDTNLGAFMDALDEMGIANQVLVCTHSDFNRTMQCNSSLGTDHGWGNHQLILGGGVAGGRILGEFPSLDLGGSDDFGTQGVWIPTTSVTQMTAGIGAWMGLSSDQIATVFPDLGNFPAGALQL
jgi:uncharacterized protein (DUF1501 family)